MPLFRKNSLVNTEFKVSQLLSYSLEVIQLITREKELLMPCHLSLKRNQTSKFSTLRRKKMSRLSLRRNFLFFSLFLSLIKRVKSLSLVSVLTMRLLTVLSLLPRTILLLSYREDWELLSLEALMMESRLLI